MPDPAFPRNTYSVLVAGGMNPSLHHPQWYRSLGAIDDAELDASLKSGATATTPIVSRLQFGSPALTVICQPNLWVIQANEDGCWDRMLTTASLVFDKKNNQITSAFGLMAQRHIDTEANAKEILAAAIAGLDLGFPVQGSVSTNITMASPGEEFTITSSIQSSIIGERTVFGLYHRDYPAQEITSTSDPRFSAFISGSQQFFADIVSSVNIRGEKGDQR